MEKYESPFQAGMLVCVLRVYGLLDPEQVDPILRCYSFVKAVRVCICHLRSGKKNQKLLCKTASQNSVSRCHPNLSEKVTQKSLCENVGRPRANELGEPMQKNSGEEQANECNAGKW